MRKCHIRWALISDHWFCQTVFIENILAEVFSVLGGGGGDEILIRTPKEKMQREIYTQRINICDDILKLKWPFYLFSQSFIKI